MDLFGWLFERNNPGPTGSFEKHYNGRQRTHFSIIAGGMVSLLSVIVPFYFIVELAGFSWTILAIYAVLISIYLFLSYQINPLADTRNMGFLGFINNPFRYTDDINRVLIFFKIFLYPGRLIGIGLVDFWELISAGAQP